MKIHIANTFFEWELEKARDIPLSQAFHSHLIHLQLQFLPVLYAPSTDAFLISDPPSPLYWEMLIRQGIYPPQPINLANISNALSGEIESWGYSPIIAKWAKEQGLSYQMPDWDVVATVNSKAFSFAHTPRLPKAELLYNEDSAQKWIGSFPGKKVIKSTFGLSGKGHFLIDAEFQQNQLSIFLQREFAQKRGVICEPWVIRALDFSTQWIIDTKGEIQYLGATLCQNNSRGQYESSSVANELKLFGTQLPFLNQHKQVAEGILKKIALLGYFGNVGIDAMLYREDHSDEIQLQPIVEVNARKTMGWAALQYQQRYAPDSLVRFHFATSLDGGYLPVELHSENGREIRFRRNLFTTSNCK